MGMWDDLGKKKITPFVKPQEVAPVKKEIEEEDTSEPTLRQKALGYNRKDYGIFGNKKSKEDPRSNK